MLHTKFRRNWPRFFKGFYHILTWKLSWSFDQHHINVFTCIQNLVKNGLMVLEKVKF